MTVVLVAAAALLAVGAVRAVARCRRELLARKAAARTRAAVARRIEIARHGWDAHTARLAVALEPVLAADVDGLTVATAGFGDAIVTEERVRTALRSITPPAPLEDRFS